MKKQLLLFWFLLLSVVVCEAQSVVFTSLQGNAATVTSKNNSNLVVYGFSVFVPAGGAYNPTVLHISTSTGLNGFISATLNQTSTNDPNLATSSALNSYAVAINSTLDINSFPSLTGAAGTGTTYYYYLVASITNTANPQPANVYYSLPASGSIGQNTYSGGITVNNTNSKTYSFAAADVKPTFTYTNQVFTVNTPITAVSPSNTGGTATTASSSPTLPAGLSISSTGVITGTPTVASAATNYTITLSNSAGSNTGTINITVNPAFAISAPASNTSYSIGSNFNITVSNTPSGTARVEYYANGNLLSTSTTSPFTQSVLASTGGSYSIIAKAYNSTSGGTLLATTAAIIINIYPPAPTTTNGSRCGPGTVTVSASGTPTGGTFYLYAAATGGTAISSSTSTSFATPSISATTVYYVSYAVSGVESTSRTAVTATVNPLPSSTFTATSPVNINTNSTVTLTSTYSASNTYSWDFNGGTPSTGSGQGPFNVQWSTSGTKTITLTTTVTATGCTSVTTQTVTVILPPAISYTTPQVLAVNTAITAIAPTNTGGTVSSYSITGTLPTGLSFNNLSGVISGTPTATQTATNYTVTATNSSGTSTAVVSIAVVANVNSSNYAFSRPLTLNTTSLGITSNLSNFPVLLSIQNNDLIISNSACNNKVYNPNGPAYDFAFTATGSSAELYYQVESYNQTTGTLLVWVQVPILTYATNNVLNFYYGSKTSSNHNNLFFQSTWANVGSTTKSYNGVWHFNEAPSNTTAALLDATSAGNNLISGNTGATQNTSSIIGNGLQLSSSYVSDAVTGYPTLNSDLTMSVWAKYNATPASNQNMMVLIGSNSNANQMAYRGSATPLVANYGGGTIVSSNVTVDNSWHHIVYTYSNTTGKDSIFVDGAFKATSTTIPQSGAITNIFFGDYATTNAGEYFNGSIDEARVINTPLTANWIKAEYGNQSNSGSFTIVGNLTTNATNAAAIAGALTYTWTGGTSTDPSNANNWTNTTTGVANQLPAFDGTATLVVPTGLTRYPKLTANIALYGLTVSSGANIDLNGFTLTVGCNITNNGTINPAGVSNASTVTWNGTLTPQLYTGNNNANTAQFGNMTINNTATSGVVKITAGPVNIYNTITLTNGSLNIDNANNGILTLKSSASITGSVAAITALGSSITGSVIVERYFTGGSPSNRNWRLMSSPVNNNSTATTPAALSSATFNFSSLKTNLLITGLRPYATTGFDASISNPDASTILTYNTNADNFTALPSITTNRSVGSGFYFYFRGDNINNLTTTNSLPTKTSRGSNGAYATPEANLVGLQSGTLNQGGLTYSLTNTGKGYNLVGNPYPSAIVLPTTALSSGNTTGFIYTYSPAAASLTAQTLPFTIASGQGFFVKTSGTTGTPSITFAETYKTNTQPSALLFTSTAEPQEGNITLQLKQDSANYDIARLRFADNYKSIYNDQEDADDLNGSGQTVFMGAMTSDNHLVAIASQPIGKQKTSVYLSVNDNISGLYSIKKMDLSGIPPVYDVWLMDHFKNDSLDLRANDNYNFNLDKTNAATYGNSRFEVVIRKKVLPPYKLISFSGQKSATGIILDWNTLNEYDYTTFELQKSTDGKTFEPIQSMLSASLGSYSYKDITPAVSSNEVYYRLKQTDINETVTYSNIVIILTKGANGSNFSIYPNPVANTLQYNLYQQITSSLKLNIFNSVGRLMKTNTFTTATGQQDVSSLIPGTYTIELIDVNTKKVVISGKFIKL